MGNSGEKKNSPAFINKQKDHKTEKTTESRCDSDPGHNVVSFVKFDFQLLPLAEGRRRFRQERRRVHPPRRRVARVHVAAYDTPHICTHTHTYDSRFLLNIFFARRGLRDAILRFRTFDLRVYT